MYANCRRFLSFGTICAVAAYTELNTRRRKSKCYVLVRERENEKYFSVQIIKNELHNNMFIPYFNKKVSVNGLTFVVLMHTNDF